MMRAAAGGDQSLQDTVERVAQRFGRIGGIGFAGDFDGPV
jgi:hypothetical protein